ncbi:hypothetical protein MED222_06410 [Vibrio sp. MED222]|nr:hypothetical protein MED222_06410 [Vibrio sp. MED222]
MMAGRTAASPYQNQPQKLLIARPYLLR